MEFKGQVTLSQVQEAIRLLGGKATRPDFLSKLTQLRGGDISYYKDQHNYETSAWQVVQQHTPGYDKYIGPPHFEKIGNGKVRMISDPNSLSSIGTPVEPPHTPVAADITASDQPERVRQETYRILRDTMLAREVKEFAQYRCQICGTVIQLGVDQPYAEAHHVRPLGSPHDGPDIRENILCVCPNDHVRLDYGAIRLDRESLPNVRSEFIDYHNNKIFGQIT